MYTREVKILPSDAAFNGQIKLRNFLDYLQDTASLAVEDLEGSTSELMARGYAWVLTRYEIEFTAEDLPSLDDVIKINTFHDPNHGYGTLRVFKVSKINQNILAWAKTSWLLLDLAAGRPVKPVEHLPEILTRDNESISPDFREIPKLNLNNIIEAPCEIRFHDLDVNGHANNAAYFEWVFEASRYIQDFDLMKYKLKSVSANFRSGVKWGDNLKILISEIESGNNNLRSFVYNIINKNINNAKPTAFLCVWEIK